MRRCGDKVEEPERRELGKKWGHSSEEPEDLFTDLFGRIPWTMVPEEQSGRAC